MAKSTWKFNHLDNSFYKNIFLNKFKVKKKIQIFSRRTTVPSYFLHKAMYLYKGNTIIRVLFNRYMLGYKIGEFGITRKPFSFPKKTKKKK